MTVLRAEVWVSIVAALVVTGIMIWLLDRYSPYSAQNNAALYPPNCRCVATDCIFVSAAGFLFLCVSFVHAFISFTISFTHPFFPVDVSSLSLSFRFSRCVSVFLALTHSLPSSFPPYLTLETVNDDRKFLTLFSLSSIYSLHPSLPPTPLFSPLCRKFTLKESFWFALTSFTPQGGGEAPKALSGRTLVAAYWLFVVLMLATFTANLAAFLTVERMQV